MKEQHDDRTHGHGGPISGVSEPHSHPEPPHHHPAKPDSGDILRDLIAAAGNPCSQICADEEREGFPPCVKMSRAKTRLAALAKHLGPLREGLKPVTTSAHQQTPQGRWVVSLTAEEWEHLCAAKDALDVALLEGLKA
jgi:hypothetical protein